jgi:hypothetical protein
MKRQSITAIIYKAQILTLRASESKMPLSTRYCTMINFATVNEIIRLHAEDNFEKLVQYKINMQGEADKLFEAVGIICKDYNDKILKP